MDLTPSKICEDFRHNKINRHFAIELLISLIENSENKDIRLGSLRNLKEICGTDEIFFELLENLLISDTDEEIRKLSAEIIKNNFIDKAIEPMKWAIQHESDYDCLITVIKTLVEVNHNDSKLALIEELKKIKKIKYLDKSKRIDNKKFKKSLKNLLKERNFKDLDSKFLAEIIINYKTIAHLTQKFYSVYFSLENALVVKLDLADVEYEVRGWKADFKNNIKEISEITGLQNLKTLKHLNISNNLIENIKGLLELNNITHLYLSNNKINNSKNLEFLKKMTNLNYLDIAGNGIIDVINFDDFPNIEINLKKIFI